MIDLGYEIAAAKCEAIQAAAQYVSDDLPEIPQGLDFNGVGFRAIPPLVRTDSGRPVMAHNECGFFLSKMCLFPERNYDEYIGRLLLIKHAEEQSGKSRFIAVEDFTVSALVRLYALMRGRINVSEQMWERVRKSLLDTVYAPYFEPMSENHKLCFLSSELIAAQMFPDDIFYDGMSGRQRLGLVSGWVVSFLTKRLRRGWSEYDSTSYYEIDFMSLINIFDFAEDKRIKKLASDCMNVMCAGMFIHASNGYTAGPKGRVYPNAMENPRVGFYSVAQLGGMTGEICRESAQVTGMMYMATSSFMLDDAVYELVTGHNGADYEIKDSVGLYTIPDDMYIKGRIYKYYYKGDGYCMGCVIHRDNPYENVAYTWLCGHQEQAWSLTFGANPKAVIYSVHPGNPQMYDYGMHAEWTGDCNCLCQQFAQDKNQLLCRWKITDKRQLQYIRIYLPEAEFDFVEYSPDCIIAAIGGTAVRITANGKFERICKGAYKNRELRINAKEGCFFCEVFSGENSYECAQKSTIKPTLHSDGAAAGRLKLADGIAYADEKPFDKSEYGLYNSPYLKSEYDSGKIELIYNGKSKIYAGQ